MKIRIFLPTDDALEPFPFGEFEFDVMPCAGDILRFTDLEDADYPVEQSGFIQADKAFTGAVWLGPPRQRSGMLDAAAEPDDAAARDARADATEIPDADIVEPARDRA